MLIAGRAKKFENKFVEVDEEYNCLKWITSIVAMNRHFLIKLFLQWSGSYQVMDVVYNIVGRKMQILY